MREGRIEEGECMRTKMDRRQRAKQFMPFSALSGLEQELAKQELPKVSRRELSPEAVEEVNRVLKELQVRDIVTITYFHRTEYRKITGMVSELDLTARKLKIVNVPIPMADIYSITRV